MPISWSGVAGFGVPSAGIGGVAWGWRPPQPVAAPVAAPASIPTVTGIDPNELAQATYGKPIPISALGKARIGTAGIIFGPYVEGGAATFAVSFGVPADPDGTRAIYEIAFDSKVAWEDAAGFSGAGTPATGFKSEPFTFRFKQGTLTQAVDALETAKFGAEAIAYRPQMVLFIENLPLAQFGNKIPFVAALIGDTTDGADPDDGINLGDALERMAYSPFAGFTTSDFETDGITDILDGGMIIAQETSLLDLLQTHNRVYRNLDIIQTDKLRVIDRGPPSTADITLNLDRILNDDPPVVYSIQEPESVPRELEVKTIDPDADYTIVPSLVQRPAEPVAVSASHGKDSIYLPIILSAPTRQSLAAYAKYSEEQSRKRVSFKAMAYGLAIEPGDRVLLIDIADGIDDELFRIVETTHGANFVVECVGESILNCALPSTASASLVDVYSLATTQNTYTFLDVSIGTPADDRLVVIVVGINKTISPVRDISTVTVDGVSATIHENISNGDAGIGVESNVSMAIAAIAVAAGFTADIVVTTSGNVSSCFIAIYSLYGLASQTPHDTASNGTTGSNPALTLNVPANGIVIAGYNGTTGSIGAVAWTGLNSENYDEEISPQHWGSGASQTNMAAETGRAVSVSAPASGREIVIAASWA